LSSKSTIRIISEGSRDTELRNDAENSALHYRNKLHAICIKKKTVVLNSNNILQYYCLILFLIN